MEPGEIAIEWVVAQIDEAQLEELVEAGDETAREPLEKATRRKERMAQKLAEATAGEAIDPLPYAWDYLRRRKAFLDAEVAALKEQQDETEQRTPERRDATERLKEARRILKHTKKLMQDPMFDQVRDA